VTDTPEGDEHVFDARYFEFRYVRRVPGEPVVAYPPLQVVVSAYHILEIGPPSCDEPGNQLPKASGIIIDLPPPGFPPVGLPPGDD